jgi:hypothetical protein
MLLRILEPEIKIRPLLFSSDELALQTRREGISLVFTPRSAMDCKKKAKQVAGIGGVFKSEDGRVRLLRYPLSPLLREIAV